MKTILFNLNKCKVHIYMHVVFLCIKFMDHIILHNIPYFNITNYVNAIKDILKYYFFI